VGNSEGLTGRGSVVNQGCLRASSADIRFSGLYVRNLKKREAKRCDDVIVAWIEVGGAGS